MMRRGWCVTATMLGLLGCDGSTSEDTVDLTRPDDVPGFVAHKLSFARVEEGVSRGFDLDGVNGPGACAVDDFQGPDGRSGIDNSFAELLPLMEAAGGAAFEDLVQAAVDSGEFLFVMQVFDGVDDCMVVDIARVEGAPLVGADGEILPYQTFGLRDDISVVRDDCAMWEDDNTLVASDLQIPIQLQIFNVPVDLGFEGVSLRIHLEEDGTASGEFAGGISVQELWDEIGHVGGIGTQLLALLESLIETRADLTWDDSDACSHMSAVLAFEGIPGFLY